MQFYSSCRVEHEIAIDPREVKLKFPVKGCPRLFSEILAIISKKWKQQGVCGKSLFLPLSFVLNLKFL